MSERSAASGHPTTRPERLYFSGDAEADQLLARDPLALLIGFTLDQQVTLQKAFSGPLELRRRIGPYDARRLASMEPTELEAAFRTPPALHRFPANMAHRVQDLCAVLVRDYDGDASRIWTEASDAADLQGRLLALPGFGAMKAGTVMALLAKRFGLQLPGLVAALPQQPTLGDVDSYEARDRYQAGKRAHKAALRAAQAEQSGRR
ncbi:MAG TPA: HhH-GPD-type base excision DNA repair protein [Candidatus Limnocylindrales bacterium]|nr:HhH-GPD-type base excision DNA repair protein [Candidatus Limnocylindrales bacterium]